MFTQSTARVRASTTSKEHSCGESRFGTIVRALWPNKPALNLAQRVGCSERAAQFYITGQRKPSARALIVVMDEVD